MRPYPLSLTVFSFQPHRFARLLLAALISGMVVSPISVRGQEQDVQRLSPAQREACQTQANQGGNREEQARLFRECRRKTLGIPDARTSAMPEPAPNNAGFAPSTASRAPSTSPASTPNTSGVTATPLLKQMISIAADNGGIGHTAELSALKQQIEALPKPARGDKKVARAANDMGLAVFNAGKYDEAKGYFIDALKADPADVEIAGNLGLAAIKTGDFKQAIKALSTALALAPGRAATWANLADYYALQGQQKEAVACYALTFHFSQNQNKTRDYLQKKAASTDDPRIQQAAQQALQLSLIKGGSEAVAAEDSLDAPLTPATAPISRALPAPAPPPLAAATIAPPVVTAPPVAPASPPVSTVPSAIPSVIAPVPLAATMPPQSAPAIPTPETTQMIAAPSAPSTPVVQTTPVTLPTQPTPAPVVPEKPQSSLPMVSSTTQTDNQSNSSSKPASSSRTGITASILEEKEERIIYLKDCLSALLEKECKIKNSDIEILKRPECQEKITLNQFLENWVLSDNNEKIIYTRKTIAPVTSIKHIVPVTSSRGRPTVSEPTLLENDAFSILVNDYKIEPELGTGCTNEYGEDFLYKLFRMFDELMNDKDDKNREENFKKFLKNLKERYSNSPNFKKILTFIDDVYGPLQAKKIALKEQKESEELAEIEAEKIEKEKLKDDIKSGKKPIQTIADAITFYDIEKSVAGIAQQPPLSATGEKYTTSAPFLYAYTATVKRAEDDTLTCESYYEMDRVAYRYYFALKFTNKTKGLKMSNLKINGPCVAIGTHIGNLEYTTVGGEKKVMPLLEAVHVFESMF